MRDEPDGFEDFTPAPTSFLGQSTPFPPDTTTLPSRRRNPLRKKCTEYLRHVGARAPTSSARACPAGGPAHVLERATLPPSRALVLRGTSPQVTAVHLHVQDPIEDAQTNQLTDRARTRRMKRCAASLRRRFQNPASGLFAHRHVSEELALHRDAFSGFGLGVPTAACGQIRCPCSPGTALDDQRDRN